MELVPVVGVPDPADHLLEPVQGPAVDLLHVRQRDGILPAVEIVKVAQDVAAGVADPPVGLHQPFQDLIGNPDVHRVVLGRHPEPQDLRPVLVDDLL